MIRYLRIGWTTTCGIACVLLIVLWVRSYAWRDEFALLYDKSSLAIAQPHPGRLFASVEHQGPDNFSEDYYARLFHTKAVSTPRKLMWKSIVVGFTGRIFPGFIEIGFPYWFLVLVVASLSLAAAPWIRWRFSLRTLLISMTLVALLLGMIVSMIR